MADPNKTNLRYTLEGAALAILFALVVAAIYIVADQQGWVRHSLWIDAFFIMGSALMAWVITTQYAKMRQRNHERDV